MKFDDLKEVGKLLKANGWSDIKLRSKIKESSGTFDIVATSKGMMKKNLLVIISSDIYDAQIAIMLLDGVPKKFLKIILLESGDPFFVEHPEEIKIFTSIEEIPKG
jgi:hypothetical protein